MKRTFTSTCPYHSPRLHKAAVCSQFVCCSLAAATAASVKALAVSGSVSPCVFFSTFFVAAVAGATSIFYIVYIILNVVCKILGYQQTWAQVLKCHTVHRLYTAYKQYTAGCCCCCCIKDGRTAASSASVSWQHHAQEMLATTLRLWQIKPLMSASECPCDWAVSWNLVEPSLWQIKPLRLY